MERREVLKRIPGLGADRLSAWLFYGHVTSNFDGAGYRRDFSETDVRRIQKLVELTSEGWTLAAAVKKLSETILPPLKIMSRDRDWLFV